MRANCRSLYFSTKAPTIVTMPPLHQSRPTHFLSLPLDSESVRYKAATFSNALLNANPPLANLDASILIHPHRLHLTLGVLHLGSQHVDRAMRQAEERSRVALALEVLRSCQWEIEEALGDSSLEVDLTTLATFGSPERCRVLYAAPVQEPGSTDTLRRIGGRFFHRP